MEFIIRKCVFVCLFLFGLFHLNAQIDTFPSFVNPLKIPVLLSANFGELRPNHFHAGIDYKTESVEGKSVLSIDSGYVSRIMIRPVGYGNALYITHPSGYISVYGHLQSFAPEIDAYITQYQLQNKMHSVDVAVDPYVLSVKREQEIGKSGNSGSSGGPHVHFEIRNKLGNVAYNPFIFYPNIIDKSQPRIYSITVFPLDSISFVNGEEKKQVFAARQISPGVYRLSNKIRVKGRVGVGIRANDYMHTVSHVFGVYSVKFDCNGERLYERKLDSISFYETNDINSLLDYESFLLRKQYTEKLYVEPNNSLSIYSEINNGIPVEPHEGEKLCSVVLADFHGNTASVDFTLVYDSDSTLEINQSCASQTNSYAHDFSFSYNGFQFHADSLSFYSDFSFDVVVDTTFMKTEFSSRYAIESSELIMKKNAQIAIQTSIPDSLRTKAIVRFQLPSGAVLPIITAVSSDGVAHFETKRIGMYSVIVDTIAPYISKPNFTEGANLSNVEIISFKMSDNFSGIASYYAYIDNQWCILTYDAKKARVTLDLSKVPVEFQNNLHTLTLLVEDVCGNETIKNYTFYK